MTKDKGQTPNDQRLLAQQGETKRQQGQYEQAIAYFTEAIALNPDYAWAIAHRGETYGLMKRYAEALEDFNRAVELNPTAWNYAHRGAVYRKLYRYEEALGDFSQAIALEPNYAWAIAYRCQVYGLSYRYEDALEDFDRAITLNPKIIPAWPGERGLLLSYLGRYAEAIAGCESGVKQQPEDWVTHYTLAVVQAHWQGLNAAQFQIKKTRTLLTQTHQELSAGRLYRLGGLAALEGDTAKALAYLEKAIRLEDEPLELARRDLAWLDLRDHPQFQDLVVLDIDKKRALDIG